MESKKFNNFMNRKDDEKVNLKLKRELRAQLYNNRHFAKDARKLLEEQEKLIDKQIEDARKSGNNDIMDNPITNAIRLLESNDPKDKQRAIDILQNMKCNPSIKN
jgi:hypothetical protein